MNTMTTSPGREANKRCVTFQDGRKQLLPGIPDEITLYHIVAKLPWKTFYVLSSVSCDWLQGIRARRVYNARVLSHSAETLVIFCYKFETMGFTTVALCSKKDRSLTRLPPIPYHGDDYQWVSLDGKIYLVAGEETQLEEEDEDGRIVHRRDRPCSNKVFVFDVAGQGQWKECASMNEPRKEFGCGVLHGKLYVFGGMPHKSFVETPTTSCGSEVYDPEEDSWSPIMPMATLRHEHRVQAIWDELFVLGGVFYDPDHFDSADDISDDDYPIEESERIRWEHHLREADFLEVYNPLKDGWRVVNPPGRDRKYFLFVARGQLYSMDWSSIDFYDAKENSWTHVHSFSIPKTRQAGSVVGMRRIQRQRIEAVVAVDDELAVSAFCSRKGNEYRSRDFQSIGFGSESEEIMWQPLQFPIIMNTLPDTSNRLIQL